MELAFPLQYVVADGSASTTDWRVNFCRNHFMGERKLFQYSSWAPMAKSFHRSDRFGRLTGVPRSAKPMFAPVLAGVRAGVVTDVTGQVAWPVRVALRNDGDEDGVVRLVVDDVDGGV